MSTVRNVVRLVVRDMVRSVTGDDQIQRYFTDYSASFNSYDEFSTTVTLSGDFRIRIKHATTETSTRALLGQVSGTQNSIYTDSNRLRMRVDESTFYNFGIINGVTLSDGKLHTTFIERVGSSITAETDGVMHPVTITESGTLTLDALGTLGLAGFWQGQLFDLSIEKAGTLVVDMPLDEPPEATERINRADPLNNATRFNQPASQTNLFTEVSDGWEGEELWTFGDISAIAQSSGFIGGVNVPVVSGYTYKFVYTVNNYIEGRAVAFSGVAGDNRDAEGDYEDVITASSTQAGWLVATNPTALDVDNGSIKRFLEVAP